MGVSTFISLYQPTQTFPKRCVSIFLAFNYSSVFMIDKIENHTANTYCQKPRRLTSNLSLNSCRLAPVPERFGAGTRQYVNVSGNFIKQFPFGTKILDTHTSDLPSNRFFNWEPGSDPSRGC
jgi:hypothetical protein